MQVLDSNPVTTIACTIRGDITIRKACYLMLVQAVGGAAAFFADYLMETEDSETEPLMLDMLKYAAIISIVYVYIYLGITAKVCRGNQWLGVAHGGMTTACMFSTFHLETLLANPVVTAAVLVFPRLNTTFMK